MSAFFDTNILIYRITTDDPRQHAAHRVLSQRGSISLQVLNEFAVVARCKHKLSWTEIAIASQRWRSLLKVVPVTVETHESALALSERHDFAFYDALIVAAALEAKCTTLYTEDMQHGMVVGDSLRIVNPFRDAGPNGGNVS